MARVCIGATVAIVGMGQVGRAIARRLGGFGCQILAVDPKAEMLPNTLRTRFEAALPASDFVILAAPLTQSTRHLIGREALSRMKPGRC